MSIQDELTLSYYKEIAYLSEEHHVAYVQHVQTKRIFLKKTLDVYNLRVYTHLKEHPVPGIPRIYELAEQDNTLTVIEDYISGQSLEAILEKRGALPEDAVIKYTSQICETLSRLHSMDPPVIHRDIKPTNIIITSSDDAVLIDLNAAKYATDKDKDTTLLGTQGYAAPEQYGFGSSTPQTDIFAVGVLMNTMLNGSYTPQPVSGKYSSIIRKCTELTPANRYNSIDDLAKALGYHTDHAAESRNLLSKVNMKYIPPGFRSGNTLYMLIAAAYYIFIIWLCHDMQFQTGGTGAPLYIQRIGFFAILLSIPLNSLNFMDIHSRLPLCNSDNPAKRILGIVFLNIIVIFLLLFIMLTLLAAFS